MTQCNPLSIVCYVLWCVHLRVSSKFLFNGMTCNVFIVHIHASFLLCKKMKQFGIWWKGGCELFSLNAMCSWQWFFSIFPPNYLISQKWWIFLEINTFNTEKHVFTSIFSKIFVSKILQTLDDWLVFWWCIWSAFATIQCTHTLEPPTNGTHVKVSNQSRDL